MSKTSRLKDYIQSHKLVTYQEVKEHCLRIDEMWRPETWTRALRILTQQGLIETIKNNKGANIAYKWNI